MFPVWLEDEWTPAIGEFVPIIAHRWKPLEWLESPVLYLWGMAYTTSTYIGLDVPPEPAFPIRVDGRIDSDKRNQDGTTNEDEPAD